MVVGQVRNGVATQGLSLSSRAAGRTAAPSVRLRRVGFWLVVAGIVVWSLFPFLWQTIASFEPDRMLGARTPQWIPDPGTLQHYFNVFAVKHFQQYLINSVIVAGSATLIALAFATMAAYALARLALPGKGIALALILAISMFPQIAIVSPLYEVLNAGYLLDTYRGLAGVYIGLSMPLMVYILYGHFRLIPKEIDESAKIDGAGPLRTLARILFPMVLPGALVAGLLGFITNWNEFMLALAFESTPAHQTVPVGIANFTALYFVPWGDIAAASVVVTLPLVVLVVVFQRRIVGGLTLGAVKE
jgi:ABC-type glycerol-3-phosphate transport system permease component